MTKNFKPSKLTDNQVMILHEFILQFLPKRGNKRKNSGNEISYVHNVLDKVFNKYFRFHLTKEDILSTFGNLQYNIFVRKDHPVPQSLAHYPIKYISSVAFRNASSEFDSSYAHIDISPIQIRLLTSARFDQTRITDKKKAEAVNQLKIRLELFCKKFNT